MNVAERTFVILKYVNRIPTVAACTHCDRKFFIATSYFSDRLGSEKYLRGEFDQHKCDGDEPRRRE